MAQGLPPTGTAEAIVSLYKEAASQQLQASASLDSKIGFVLAFDGGLAGLIFVRQHVAMVTFITLVLSTVAAGAALLSRRFLYGPNPDWLYANFGSNSPEELNVVVIRSFSDSLRFNDTHLTRKARLLLLSAISLLVAAALLGLQSTGVIR